MRIYYSTCLSAKNHHHPPLGDPGDFWGVPGDFVVQSPGSPSHGTASPLSLIPKLRNLNGLRLREAKWVICTRKLSKTCPPWGTRRSAFFVPTFSARGQHFSHKVGSLRSRGTLKLPLQRLPTSPTSAALSKTWSTCIFRATIFTARRRQNDGFAILNEKLCPIEPNENTLQSGDRGI